VVEGIARHLEAKHPPPRRACARASTTCSPCAASESAKVARDRTGTAAENRLAEAIDTVPKLVLSRTLDSVAWNGHVASSPPEEEVRRLRGGGGRFLVQASPGLAADLRAAGSIDRYRLLLQPLVAGRGPALFATDEVVTVSLEAAVAFQSGAVALDYAFR
jgi:dihydrofolate reductase